MLASRGCRSTSWTAVKSASLEWPLGATWQRGRRRLSQVNHSADAKASAYVPAAVALVDEMGRRGLLSNERVASAMKLVDRATFLSSRQGAPPDSRAYALDRVPVHEEDLFDREFPLDNPVDHVIQLEALEPWLRPGAHVLDCGSGSGYLSTVMAILVAGRRETGGAVVGADRFASFASTCVPRIAQTLNSLAAIPDASSTVGVDPSVLERMMIIPVDATSDAFLPKAPFDAIRVGFALPSSDCKEAGYLFRQLKRGGRMVAHLAGSPFLHTFDKAEDGTMSERSVSRRSFAAPPLGKARVHVEADNVDPVGMPGAAPPGANAVDPEEAERQRKALAKQELERTELRNRLFNELQAWRSSFERDNGRRPSREDMAADPVAAKLFADFSRVNRPDPL